MKHYSEAVKEEVRRLRKEGEGLVQLLMVRISQKDSFHALECIWAYLVFCLKVKYTK